MQRGEVWWADVYDRDAVVLLSADDPTGLRALLVVEPAGVDLGDRGAEIAVGRAEGLPHDGAVRIGYPTPSWTPCTWLVTLTRECLVERTGSLSPGKLDALTAALRRGRLE